MFISVQMHQNLQEVRITKDEQLQVLHNDLLGIHMYGEEQALPVVLTALASCRVYMQTLA